MWQPVIQVISILTCILQKELNHVKGSKDKHEVYHHLNQPDNKQKQTHNYVVTKYKPKKTVKKQYPCLGAHTVYYQMHNNYG